MDLIELARIRQERAGQKYIMPDGRNQAEVRDGGLDIMEELADAWNIANLWEQRMSKAGLLDERDYQDRLADLRNCLDWCAGYVESIRSRLPEDFRRDLIEVDRIARWEE